MESWTNSAVQRALRGLMQNSAGKAMITPQRRRRHGLIGVELRAFTHAPAPAAGEGLRSTIFVLPPASPSVDRIPLLGGGRIEDRSSGALQDATDEQEHRDNRQDEQHERQRHEPDEKPSQRIRPISVGSGRAMAPCPDHIPCQRPAGSRPVNSMPSMLNARARARILCSCYSASV